MNVYRGRLLKKSSNRKSKLVLSTLVTTWFWNITFHLLPIWLQTLVAIDSELRLTSFPSFCAPPSEVAVLFYSNLSRRPFLGQVVDIDLLLCTGFNSEHVVLFWCHILAQRRMNDRKIKQSNGRCLGRRQLLADSKKNFSPSWKKKRLVAARNLQSIKILLALELSQNSKSGSMFSSSEPVAAHSDCRRLGNALCLCSPIWPAQAEQESGPKSLAVAFAL